MKKQVEVHKPQNLQGEKAKPIVGKEVKENESKKDVKYKSYTMGKRLGIKR